MAAIRTLKPRAALLNLLSELRYTLSRIQANPLAAPLVPSFKALKDQWTVVQAKEIACTEAISDAQALVDQADDDLDDFASKLSKVLLTITKDDDKAELYVHFFNGKTVVAFCKPILNKQLAEMEKWITSLEGSSLPALKTLAPELTNLIQAANGAVTARADAQQQNKLFREIGERQQFVDDLNAARKSGFGELGKIGASTPGLPADFPNRFFRVVDDTEPPPTIDSVQKKIGELTTQLQAENALLEKLESDANAAAAEADKKKAKDAQVAALKEQRDALAKQIDALEKQ